MKVYVILNAHIYKKKFKYNFPNFSIPCRYHVNSKESELEEKSVSKVEIE